MSGHVDLIIRGPKSSSLILFLTSFSISSLDLLLSVEHELKSSSSQAGPSLKNTIMKQVVIPNSLQVPDPITFLLIRIVSVEFRIETEQRCEPFHQKQNMIFSVGHCYFLWFLICLFFMTRRKKVESNVFPLHNISGFSHVSARRLKFSQSLT